MTVRRTPCLLAAAAVCAGALALSPTTAGGQTSTCEQPYSPLATAATYPQQESLPAVDAAVVSTAFDRSQAPVDMDGDGNDDTILVGPFSQDVTVTRGDGVLQLATGGPSSTEVDGLGDLDGDGRDELGVVVSGGSDPGSYVLPGTTPPGTTTVAAAGILVRAGGELIGIDDGSDRLLLFHDGVTDVLVGPDVLAAGPGGDATGATPTETVPGEPVSRADLGGTEAVVATLTVTPDSSEIALLGPALVRLTTSPAEYLGPDTGDGSVEILDGPDGTFVTLAHSTRSGARAWMWSLDRPCGPLIAPDDSTPPMTTPTTTPTAPAAQPVDAAAAFAG